MSNCEFSYHWFCHNPFFFTFVPSAIAALVMEMTYGLHVADNKDRFLRATVEAMEITTRAMIPGAFLVDTIPIRASSTGYAKT